MIMETVASYNDIAITFNGDVSVEEAKKKFTKRRYYG